MAVRDCRACEQHLPLGPRPVLRAAVTARILIVGQAPGVRVHTSGIPWDDPSGERLRAGLGVDKDVFYDESRIAIIPSFVAPRGGIHRLLTASGWLVCNVAEANIHVACGVAIHEFPLKSGHGFADYLLYIDGKAA